MEQWRNALITMNLAGLPRTPHRGSSPSATREVWSTIKPASCTSERVTTTQAPGDGQLRTLLDSTAAQLTCTVTLKMTRYRISIQLEWGRRTLSIQSISGWVTGEESTTTIIWVV